MESPAAQLDLVCLGRAGVDFYAEQIGSRLEDVASFAKYIGGSSTALTWPFRQRIWTHAG